MFEVLTVGISRDDGREKNHWTYAKTLENSLDGDMTKLSFVVDHEIRC